MKLPSRLILSVLLFAEQKEASSYLWTVWEVMVDVVRSPHATSEIHKHLVSILQGLVLIAKGELVVWNVSIDSRHLPLARLLISLE
ncbi:hypothetical protein M441DRAFT_394292 [Trichoderma asperellum CBS 433.97]|uniref:Uncharacterized protein n=1 Tax=Trichoderma asperellum (strain ATCC 204424 / CBS 433.97 / NBRC 101777) TaxID=1042311 RepID=A0A2T3ZD51_TRIA4|nr:hypothetical protein M441DRAFT_394292 [Trichoderma asperellum CBS 433.97]PTB42738.1 hypothetical protein M441DRAFT_394292 [Trichoderma asperellum CBS 433.97]